MKNKKITKIADLLPKDLSESTVNKIAELVDSTIKEEVEKRVSNLSTKTTAFIRNNIDSLKEQAQKELELTDELYRKAKLFEDVRALMSVELTEEDHGNAITALTTEQKQLEEENTVLAEELNTALTENNRLESVIKALNEKVETLSEGVKKIEAEKQKIQEQVAKPFKSSEKAVIISHNKEEVAKEKEVFKNEFLTEDVLKFMPKKVAN